MPPALRRPQNPISIIMKKELLQRFMAKYRLNGIINEAVWIVNDGTLRAAATGWGNKVFAGITCREFYELDDVQIGIIDAKKLAAMLKALPSKYISLAAVKYSWGDVAALTLEGDTMRVEYIASNPKDIDVPNMKNIPAWNAAIILHADFKARFLKAYNAIGDEQALFTVAMSERTGKLELVMDCGGDGALHLGTRTVDGASAVKAPISFSATCLKSVLQANPEFKEPILSVSDAGLASIGFSGDDLEAEYYLVRIEVED